MFILLSNLFLAEIPENTTWGKGVQRPSETIDQLDQSKPTNGTRFRLQISATTTKTTVEKKRGARKKRGQSKGRKKMKEKKRRKISSRTHL